MEIFGHPAFLTVAIFLARLADVSLGTVRTILVFRGLRSLAAAVGFLEVLIWLAAAARVIGNLDAWYMAFGYAAGFAAGNYAGVWIEQRLAIGAELLRVISTERGIDVAQRLRRTGLSVIELAGRNEDGRGVEVLYLTVPRRRIGEVLREVAEIDSGAICTTTDIRARALDLPSSRRPRRRMLRRALGVRK